MKTWKLDSRIIRIHLAVRGQWFDFSRLVVCLPPIFAELQRQPIVVVCFWAPTYLQNGDAPNSGLSG